MVFRQQLSEKLKTPVSFNYYLNWEIHENYYYCLNVGIKIIFSKNLEKLSLIKLLKGIT